MHLKVFVKLKKTLKTLSSGQKTQKKQKTTKNPKKNQKTQKKPLGWVLKKKTGFFQPCLRVVKTKLYLGVKVRTRRVSPGVGGEVPWLEQAGLRVINKLYLGVKVRTSRASPGVGGADPWLEQAGLKTSCTLE
jgi:hypothetical protein